MGKRSVCKYPPNVTNVAIKTLLSKELGLSEFNEQDIQDNIPQVLTATDGETEIVRKFGMDLQL